MFSYISVLFRKHKKVLPKRLESTVIGEFLRYGFMIFLSAWVLQGVRIMNNKERLVKIFIDVFLTILFISCGVHWILSLLFAHTLNFVFNGQFHAMFTHMGATGQTAEHFLRNTIWIRAKIQGHQFIDAAIAYGSLSRGCYKKTSDIDLRLIPAKGCWREWKCAIYAAWLRCLAFIKRYPLDLYVYSPEEVMRRMSTDELPVIIVERNGCMREYYPERVEFEDFVKVFGKMNL